MNEQKKLHKVNVSYKKNKIRDTINPPTAAMKKGL